IAGKAKSQRGFEESQRLEPVDSAALKKPLIAKRRHERVAPIESVGAQEVGRFRPGLGVKEPLRDLGQDLRIALLFGFAEKRPGGRSVLQLVKLQAFGAHRAD